MNEVPQLGSEWKGRIYIAIYIDEMKSEKQNTTAPAPILGKQTISDVKFLTSAEYMTTYDYEVMADIYYAMNLPADEKYTIKIKWAAGGLETSFKVFCPI